MNNNWEKMGKKCFVVNCLVITALRLFFILTIFDVGVSITDCSVRPCVRCKKSGSRILGQFVARFGDGFGLGSGLGLGLQHMCRATLVVAICAADAFSPTEQSHGRGGSLFSELLT